MALDPRIRRILLRCKRSPSYFIDNFCYVKHPSAGIVPFKLFSYQRNCLKQFMEHRFNIFKKTRQCGISTLVGAFSLWLALFYSSKTILIVSKRDDDAMRFLDRNVLFPYNYLPAWMQDLWDIEQNKHEFKTHKNSSILSLSSSKDTLRSNASSFNVIDEAAFMPHASEMWSGGYSTLAHGGSAVVISTTNGIGNWYWQTWSDAVNGDNDFNPISINWWDMDWEITFNDPMSGKKRTIAPTANMVKLTDPKKISKYGPYWSPWLEGEYRGLTQRGDDFKFRQEVLAEFLGTGNTVLGRETLKFLENTVDNNFETVGVVKYVNPISGDRVDLNFDHNLRIWNTPVIEQFRCVLCDYDPGEITLPEKGKLRCNKCGNGHINKISHMYTMGVDIASGEAKDFSTITVLDIVTREQVAELKIKAYPKDFAKMVDYIGRMYNNALAVVERTGMGITVVQDLNEYLGYPNLFRERKIKPGSQQKKLGHFGFHANRTNKAVLNKALLDYMCPDGFSFKSSRLYKECQIYINLPNGDTGCEPGTGNNDDLVISTGLALIGCNHFFGGGMNLMSPYSAKGDDEIPIDDLTSFRMKGGPNALLPVHNINEKVKTTSALELMSNFMTQLGGVPIDKNGKPVGMPTVIYRKHNIKHRMKKR